jgi:aminoacrylate hydrolase
MPLLTLRDGGHLYYEVHGTGPPLLLVPGLGGLSSFWQPHVAVLAEQFTVVLHDHRGTGQSSLERIDFSVGQMAADLLGLMDHLGIERAHLVGHSTGGAIGQTIALDAPERLERLVLSATWPAADDYFRLLFDSRAEILRQLGPGAYQRASALFLWPPFWVRDHLEVAAIDDEEAARRIPDPELVLRRIAAIQRFVRRSELHRITVPTLVVGAADDTVTPAYFSEDIGRLIPRSETVILPQGGHFFPVTEADSFRRLVLGVLAR